MKLKKGIFCTFNEYKRYLFHICMNLVSLQFFSHSKEYDTYNWKF